VGSWTTADASLRFAPALPGAFSGIHFSLAVLNVFDKGPPGLITTMQGINYDSANTSPMGRFLTLRVSKEW
jgi:outer membrane receptor protein involved in Fe transport